MFKRKTKQFSTNIPPRYETELGQKNIIVFGEAGVGKSSLIDMVADEKLASTSSNAMGRTFETTRFTITIESERYIMWETAGMEEGTHGTVPGPIALSNMKQLLRDLSEGDGISLLVYCIRGPRIRSGLVKNYKIFYSAVCRKKVPIVAVVTGLEDEVEMDKWWSKNEQAFQRNRMVFADHACVTTLRDDTVITEPIQHQPYPESRTKVRRLLREKCRSEPWKASGQGFIKATLADVSSMLNPRWNGETTSIPNVITCDITGHDTKITDGNGGVIATTTKLNPRGNPYRAYHLTRFGMKTRNVDAIKNYPNRADLLIVYIAPGRLPYKHSLAQIIFALYRTSGGDDVPTLILVNNEGEQKVVSRNLREENSKCDVIVRQAAMAGKEPAPPNTPEVQALVKQYALEHPPERSMFQLFIGRLYGGGSQVVEMVKRRQFMI